MVLQLVYEVGLGFRKFIGFRKPGFKRVRLAAISLLLVEGDILSMADFGTSEAVLLQ